MLISDILRHKNASPPVITIAGTATVTELLSELAAHRVGALVVVDGDGHLAGIVSERDVVRRLNDRGPDVLGAAVNDIMTSPVHSCAPDDAVDDIATTMTERRFRHMPVQADGELVGIVSIGDVVSSRMRALEQDREHLEHYING